MPLAPPADAPELVSTASLHRGCHTTTHPRTHSPVHALRSVSVLQVPQGYERGGCGVPALYVKREERGSVPASRRLGEFFEVGVESRDG